MAGGTDLHDFLNNLPSWLLDYNRQQSADQRFEKDYALRKEQLNSTKKSKALIDQMRELQVKSLSMQLKQQERLLDEVVTAKNALKKLQTTTPLETTARAKLYGEDVRQSRMVGVVQARSRLSQIEKILKELEGSNTPEAQAARMIAEAQVGEITKLVENAASQKDTGFFKALLENSDQPDAVQKALEAYKSTDYSKKDLSGLRRKLDRINLMIKYQTGAFLPQQSVAQQ